LNGSSLKVAQARNGYGVVYYATADHDDSAAPRCQYVLPR